ncbi:MAG: hypothetical protein H0V27_01625 [Pyrinomonadaceae bacterium]|jgi:hypothetical protein|nr:hypothetical protein [Pyrinomonadaceae bacterium]
MRLRLYCNRYEHFKDALVCSVNCAYRTRCGDFALFYDDNRTATDALVEDYLERRRGGARPSHVTSEATLNTNSLVRLEVKREMAEAAYIWINSDDRAELLETQEVLRRAERGAKAKHIYRVAQEMELRFQLVPRKRIEKARRAADVEAERATARRSRLRSVPAVAEPEISRVAATPPPAESSTAVPLATTTSRRRSRTTKAKVAGGR